MLSWDEDELEMLISGKTMLILIILSPNVYKRWVKLFSDENKKKIDSRRLLLYVECFIYIWNVAIKISLMKNSLNGDIWISMSNKS